MKTSPRGEVAPEITTKIKFLPASIYAVLLLACAPAAFAATAAKSSSPSKAQFDGYYGYTTREVTIPTFTGKLDGEAHGGGIRGTLSLGNGFFAEGSFDKKEFELEFNGTPFPPGFDLQEDEYRVGLGVATALSRKLFGFAQADFLNLQQAINGSEDSDDGYVAGGGLWIGPFVKNKLTFSVRASYYKIGSETTGVEALAGMRYVFAERLSVFVEERYLGLTREVPGPDVETVYYQFRAGVGFSF